MNLYATLADLRRYLALDGAQTGDDDLLLALLSTASRLIDGYAARQFTPVQATRVYSVSTPGVLLLDADLLALASVTNGDGSPIALDAMHVQPAEAVASSLVLDRTRAAFTHAGDPVDAIQVRGTWGYHPDWTHAWTDSGDTVQDDPLSASATTLTVADADAALATGYGARFAVGQLLRVADEYLHVLAVDAETNTLTVQRGANGTTAAEHAQGAAIAVYAVPADIRGACLRLASWLYRQPDTGFVQPAGGLRGTLVVPPALPDDVRQILAPYVRLRVT